MPEKKKAEKKSGYKPPFKKGEQGVKSSKDKTLTAEQIKTAQKMVELVGSGKVNGVLVILEEFTEGGKRGIQGTSFCHGIGPTERVQAFVSASGMPGPLFALIAGMVKD